MKGASYRPSRPDLSGVGDELRLDTLRTTSEYNSAVEEVRSLGLHPHFFRAKNWDTLSALKFILSNTGPSHSVLDAGGALYSPLVEWLYLYGYRDLCVCNIEFDGHFRRGPIEYRSADFLDREFKETTFDVVTSLSVIEHGLEVPTTLEEFYRIIKPGGFLILSTDYWEEKINTEDERTRYGENVQQWNVFDREEIMDVLEVAESIGHSSLAKTHTSVV
jgi:2-polyprenyl-3-methyl-5-hydroxy-6-metoxy-1,4-benzoquinol methylase